MQELFHLVLQKVAAIQFPLVSQKGMVMWTRGSCSRPVLLFMEKVNRKARHVSQGRQSLGTVLLQLHGMKGHYVVLIVTLHRPLGSL